MAKREKPADLDMLVSEQLALYDRSGVSPSAHFDEAAQVVLYIGDCMDLLREIPDRAARLVVTSPPYNIGKAYESKQVLDNYLDQQREVIAECVRILADDGSMCWQVGNHVRDAEVFPLDILLYPFFASHNLHLRNRIIWHFEHGLHCRKPFSRGPVATSEAGMAETTARNRCLRDRLVVDRASDMRDHVEEPTVCQTS